MVKGETVYVLGAGFSKSVGCPLVSEFTKTELINEVKRKLSNNASDLTKFAQVSRYVRDRIDDRYCEDNIESVLGHVAAAKYLYMGSTTELRNQKYPAKDIFTDIQWFIVKILEQKTKAIISREYFRFLKDICSEEHTVITFNYDLVLEKVLERLKQRFRYGIEKERSADRLILKLHGSVNWVYCYACGPVVVGPAVVSDSYVAPAIYDGTINCPNCGSKKIEPVLIPPVLYKDAFYQNSKWIRELWMKAYQELSSAQKVVFIGFSMAENDAYARELFKISSNMNTTAGLNYLVVNRVRSKKKFRQLKKRYRSVLVGENINFKRRTFLQYVRELSKK